VEELQTSKGFESFLTAQQVAAWLNMSLVWVYKAAEKGLLPFHRVGEAMRFDPNEIRSYLNKRRNLNKTYEESRNPKTRKKGVHLQPEQEVTKTG
jgi:excisionase family DNA binding protein